MNCNTCEKHIINGDLNIIEDHIETCDSCQLFLELHEYSPMKTKPEAINPYGVANAIKIYEAEKKRKDLISLFLFISIAVILMISLITMLYGHYLDSLKYYIGLITAIMPISLPILSRLTRKAVL